ncbi:MAG: CapA family protein [Eubacterium sp.]|nr:CapA family protein [Eubacterium sp.]
MLRKLFGKNNKELNPYKKGDLDYRALSYDKYIERGSEGSEPRYVKSDNENLWKLKTPTNNNKAVIMCAGDLMCEPAMSDAVYCEDDGEYLFKTCFKQIRPVLKSSDFAIANLETMVTDKAPYTRESHRMNHHTGVRYHCNAPVSYLDACRYAGFDSFVMANNHNADCDYEGLVDTLENVDNGNFARTGLFKDENDPRTLIVDINNIKVGILSYTEHINRNLDKELFTEKAQEVCFNKFDVKKLRKDIAKLKKDGAEFLLCYIHFLGRDYSHTVVDRQVKLAQTIADEGIDCIMGSHMHALQKYGVVTSKDGRRVPVTYSLGNFITSDNTSMITRTGIIYRMELEKVNGKVSISDESYIPYRVVENTARSGFVVFPTQAEWRKHKRSELLDKAQADIAKVVGTELEMYSKDNKKAAVKPVDPNKYHGEKPLRSSYSNMEPQISIREVCNLLGLDLNTPNNKEIISKYDLDKKRIVSTTNWSMAEGGIGIVRRGGLTIENAIKKHPSLVLGESEFTGTGGLSIKLPEGITPRNAYTKICRYIRNKYPIPCISITGNAGKTTTKDLISTIFLKQDSTLCVDRNYNTWYTSGEILQSLCDHHKMYVQEAHEPHAESVSFMVQPNAVLITNVERAHLDETGVSMDAAVKATLKITNYMKPDGVLFINQDCPYLSKETFDNFNVIRYSASDNSVDYWAENVVNHGTYSTFTICSKTDEPIDAVINISGIHNVNNAVGAYAVGRYYNLDPKEIVEAMETYKPGGIRQNLVKAKDCNVLVDCYSTTVLSTMAAGKTLCEFELGENSKRVMIMSYLPSLGSGSESVHRDVGKNIASLPIDLIVGYRNDAKYIIDECQKAGKEAVFFQYHKDVIEYLNEVIKPGDAVAFKGVTYAHLEQIANKVFDLDIKPDNSIENDRPHNGGDF